MWRLNPKWSLEREQDFFEEHRKRAFLAACRKPTSWWVAANRHKRAADILYQIAYESFERDIARAITEAKDRLPPGSSVSRTLEGEELNDFYNIQLLWDFYLLAGYALECILKGCLLAKRPELVRDDKRLDKIITTHKLCDLCEKLAIVLSPEEAELLEVLTHHLYWGKYPVPTELKNMPAPFPAEEEKKKAPNLENPFGGKHAQMLFDGFYQRALNLLDSLRNSQL